MKYTLKQSGFRPWLGDPECITLRRSEVMAKRNTPSNEDVQQKTGASPVLSLQK